MSGAHSDADGLAGQIRRHVTADRPFAYCDACLALRFHVSLDDARLAAVVVAHGDGFVRKIRACYGCGRMLEITSASR